MDAADINSIISTVLATTSEVLVASLPIIFGLGGLLLALGLAWFYFKKLVAKRK